MRLKTIVDPRVVARVKQWPPRLQREWIPSFPHDYVAVPAVDTYGTFPFGDIISNGDRIALARFTNALAKRKGA